MRIAPALTAALLLALPSSVPAQETRAALEAATQALGAVRSLEYTGSGVMFQAGQSPAPGQPWPRFNLKSYTRAVNYDTASLRDDLVRTQGANPPRGGGVQPVRGEQRQAAIPNAVLGDMPVEVTYTVYRDFAGVKFPTRITQSAGGFPTLDITLTDVTVYLPNDKLVSEADAFTPPAANTPPPSPPSPFTVNLSDNIKRLGLAVDRVLPLHGRMVPIADLHTAAGHGH